MTLKDADALLKYLMINMGWHDEDGREVDDWDEKREIIKNLIDGVPTVDAVPVVRCKDCKSWDKGNPFGGSELCECKTHGGYYLPEDYCSDGERRENDDSAKV